MIYLTGFGKKKDSLIKAELQASNFTYAEIEMLQKDWQSLLPYMAFRPKTSVIRFRRIVGPIVISLGLEFNGGLGWKCYSLKYFIHNLACPEDSIVMQIHNTSRKILVDFDHHKEEYLSAAEKIKQDAWIPLEGSITLDDIFNGYSKAAKARLVEANKNYPKLFITWTKVFNSNKQSAKDKLEHGSLTPLEAVTPALVAAWTGEREKAKEYWAWGSKVCDSDKMIKRYGHLIAQPELLRKTARSELIKHNMNYAPYQNIVGVSYQEPDNWLEPYISKIFEIY